MSPDFWTTALLWLVGGLGAGIGASLVIVGVVYALNVPERYDELMPPRGWADLP